MFIDKLSIGGITASSQVVESVLNYTSIFTELGGSGIVGMALDKNNTVKPIKQKTFFDNIKDELALPVLTADLYLATQGSFNFGFIYQSLIDRDMTRPMWTLITASRVGGPYLLTGLKSDLGRLSPAPSQQSWIPARPSSSFHHVWLMRIMIRSLVL